MSKNYITEKEVADRVGVSVKSIQGWRSKKCNLPFTKMGRNVRYLEEDVQDFINDKVITPITEAVVVRRKTVISVSKMSIEQLAALTTEELVDLEQKANEACKEAKDIKEWLGGVLAIKKAANCNDKNNRDLICGGENEKITDNFC